ncbi:D-ribose pyranase [Corynebacterium freiburgense]|uniref:D-ribose pyranase n=1 Tax=Corynebacterium freiburgense TaxID=556548 RepID=UPI0004238E70|nr:D-ribose pyranase [Corynebacterium freiburgense]WJZ03118.1 D-ribose pyranase [Corynebacterium freiburgense]
MKKQGLLNPELNRRIARLGHTDTFVIADCGLPIPTHVPVIDLALVFGIPRFADTVEAVLNEVVIEGVTIAKETPAEVRSLLIENVSEVSHEELKTLVGEASFVIRTGETTPYANAIFHCGVPF